MGEAPDGVEACLGGRGAALWRALREVRPFNPAERVMLEELCRMADRLDKLDEVLRGEVDTWVSISTSFHGKDREVELVLDDALAESRQLAATFSRVVAALNLPEGVPAKSKTDGIDDLTARRSARRSG